MKTKSKLDVLKVVKILCKYSNRGVDSTTLTYALRHAAQVRGYEDLVIFLVSKGADIHAVLDDKGMSALETIRKNHGNDGSFIERVQQVSKQREQQEQDGMSYGNNGDDDDDDDFEEEEDYNGSESDEEDSRLNYNAPDKATVDRLLATIPPQVLESFTQMSEGSVHKMSYKVKLKILEKIMGGSVYDYEEELDEGSDEEGIGNALNKEEDYDDDDDDDEEAAAARTAWLKKLEEAKQK
jgi:hypothetical protein